MGGLQMEALLTGDTQCPEFTILDHPSTIQSDPMSSKRLQHSYREDTIHKGCDKTHTQLFQKSVLSLNLIV